MDITTAPDVLSLAVRTMHSYYRETRPSYAAVAVTGVYPGEAAHAPTAAGRLPGFVVPVLATDENGETCAPSVITEAAKILAARVYNMSRRDVDAASLEAWLCFAPRITVRMVTLTDWYAAYDMRAEVMFYVLACGRCEISAQSEIRKIYNGSTHGLLVSMSAQPASLI
ncbi:MULTISPECIES: hypothetical protein [Streptosporangium]|uniref:Uncharacterized protein n=1 Tax=Streptosporangium brasiliense TaxID=47480 RepID=A0ABT9RM52_9ACTN|nr:hypothetical protein [Streptosporangium brasiliense]MDP9870377.1 hypothetical protein [Streptosporangium brasiliense]